MRGNAVAYSALISAFCNVNNFENAMEFFNEILTSGCSPDAIVYYNMISGFSQDGRMVAVLSCRSGKRLASALTRCAMMF